MNINIYYCSWEYTEVQAQLTALLSLHGTSSGISVTSIAAFAANTNTDTAYRQFCKDLDRVGVTEDVIRQKEDKILEILNSKGMVTSGGSDGSNIEDQEEVLETAYQQFCKGLYEAGMAEAWMPPKHEILKKLKSQVVSSSQTGGDKG